MIYKIAIAKNFAILTGKRLRWSLFLAKLQASRTAALLQRDPEAGVFFFVNIAIFKNTYFGKHLRTAASETHLINTKLFLRILLSKSMISERFRVFHKKSVRKKSVDSQKIKRE